MNNFANRTVAMQWTCPTELLKSTQQFAGVINCTVLYVQLVMDELAASLAGSFVSSVRITFDVCACSRSCEDMHGYGQRSKLQILWWKEKLHLRKNNNYVDVRQRVMTDFRFTCVYEEACLVAGNCAIDSEFFLLRVCVCFFYVAVCWVFFSVHLPHTAWG